MLRPAREPVRIAGVGLFVGIVALVAYQLVDVWPFTAEDAWIVNRYAVNLVSHGELVFNRGESVSALTSPLLGLLESLLYLVFGSIRTPYKVVSLLLLAGIVVSGASVLRKTPGALLLFVCMVVASPVLSLWIVGGLETPILALFVTLATAMVLRSDSDPSPAWCATLSALLGLAFLARYDSVLFSVPVLAAVLLRHRKPHVAIALLGGGLIPLAWLVFAASYFGDVLPTSFYVKTPGGGFDELVRNSVYTADFLLFSGILPVLLLIVVAAGFDGEARTSLAHGRHHWGLVTGLVLVVVIYGCAAATKHMMFGYRLLIPYLPAAALVLGGWFARYESASPVSGPGLSTAAQFRPRAVLILLAITTVFALQLLNTGVSAGQLAVGRLGELRTMSVREYMRHIEGIDHGSARIAEHWKATAAASNRPPRIYTYAAGILPFHLMDAYIYEALVSYRHRCRPSREDLIAMADYVHVKTPLREGLPAEHYDEELQLEAIARYDLADVSPPFTFYVFYNPHPKPNILPPGLHDDCLTP